MEKENQQDSMTTVAMKPDYPPSEVYSTSEPPPAYRQRPSSSVQIARIAALTVVAASFILGAFILASSWVSARASCHQLEQLDAMLDKELALEGRAYGNDGLFADEPLPIGNAHALHAAPPQPQLTVQPPAPAQRSQSAPMPGSLLKDDALNHAESKINEDKLQKLDENSRDDSKDVSPNSDSNEQSSESESADDDDDELDAKPLFKMPIQFDLDDLAGAFLANNQKGRMNCVVERRHEEPMERRFPFNILSAFTPKTSQAERIAIICHGGDESRPMNSFPEPASQVFTFPLGGPMRLPLRPESDRPALSQQMPATRITPFAPQHRPAPFPLPQLPWESSEESMGSPQQMRIHVQRVIAIPAPHNMPRPQDNMGPFLPPPMPQSRDQNEQPSVVHQFVPQPAPTLGMEQSDVQKVEMDGSPMPMGLPWGLTPEDLHVIHRTAEDAVANHQREQQLDNDMQEVKAIVNTLTAAAEAEAEAQAQSEPQAENQRQQTMEAPMMPPNDMNARVPRTLLLPQDVPLEERPHYVQPRSVRSVDAMLHREKRVKRCACDCA